MKKIIEITVVVLFLSLTSCGGGGDKSNGPITPSNVAVSSISLSKTTSELEIGNTLQLTATVSPSNATDKTVTWSSSNASVAAVNSTGLVTANAEGATNITASAGGKNAICKITVKKAVIAVTSIELDKTNITIDAGENSTIKATVKPDNATDKTVSWGSSKPSVASVDNNGKVTGIDNGNTDITATCGTKTATCIVTVDVKVKSVTLNKTSETIEVGGTPLILTATVSPSNAADKTINWSSSNTNVATVNNGTVTAVSSGTSTITAEASGKTATCLVTVINNSEYWTDGEVGQYEVNSDGSLTEIPLGSSSRPFKLIFMADGYTQTNYKRGDLFDKDIEIGVKAIFDIEPFKTYYSYFTIFKVAAYSTSSDIGKTKFGCKGNENYGLIYEYASKCPGIKGASDVETNTNLALSPICIFTYSTSIDSYNHWSTASVMGFMQIISVSFVSRNSSLQDMYNDIKHTYGGHGIGLLGDENESISSSQEFSFRLFQNLGAYSNLFLPAWDSAKNMWYSDQQHCNLTLTPKVEGVNWKTLADREEYLACKIGLYGHGTFYGSENGSIMLSKSIPHFDTMSRWRLYCRIKLTAGEIPSLEDFIAHDKDKINKYSSSTSILNTTNQKCEGTIFNNSNKKKIFVLK